MALNNLLKITFASILFISVCDSAKAQTKYWVKFKDKNGSPYTISNPSAFLTPKSITRRNNQGIAVDLSDIPVNETYLNQVSATGATVFARSKWMNAAIVVATSAQLTAINSLTCVLNTAPVGKVIKAKEDELVQVANVQRMAQTTAYNYGPSLTQNAQIGADCMHANGYRGLGMLIGVLDSGFSNADTNPVFDSLRNEGRVMGTRDIVAGNTSVYEDHTHGAMVLSLIVGNTPGSLIGTGPKASVYLVRTEDVGSEKPIEEYNWIVGAELADSVGADIITTSLGYTTFDAPFTSHVYADLNGRTSPMSVAATMAARKGIFVLNAAGNEGNSSWHYISVPADADSICTVGSVNGSGIHSGFSSVGPTADGRIKPDVSTRGEGSYVCDPSGAFYGGNGTSFATPIMAGAVACLWQANPTKTNFEILNAIKVTASRSSNPDNNYGWGIPNICSAHNFLNGTSLGVSELNEPVVKLYPNPAKSTISFSFSGDINTVAITDVLGNVVKSQFQENSNGNYTLVFDNKMASGIYFLTITSAGKSFNSKFIKE